RTLIPAIIPPGASHMHLVYSLAFPIESDYNVLLASQGVLSSMLSDFSVRSVPKSDIIAPVVERMAFPPSDHDFGAALKARVLMLTSLTEAYADLWNSTTDLTSSGQTWTAAMASRTRSRWTFSTMNGPNPRRCDWLLTDGKHRSKSMRLSRL